MRRAPRDIIFISSLPVVAVIELVVTAPTSWSYQLLPAVPIVLIVAGWTLRYFYFRPRRRTLWAALGGVMAVEFIFMFAPLASDQLSLSQSLVAWAVRTVVPSIDVPYGTGSEPIPALMNYVNRQLPSGSRVAGTYVDPILAQYARPGIQVGFWNPANSLSQLSAQGYQYGILINHFVASSSAASSSVASVKPLLRVSLGQGLEGELLRVPFPSLVGVPPLTFGSTPLGRIRSAVVGRVNVSTRGTSITLSGTFGTGIRPAMGVSDPAPVGVLNRISGVDLTVVSESQPVVLSVELVAPSGGYLEYEIGVNPPGPEHLWIPISMFTDNLGPGRAAAVQSQAHLRVTLYPSAAGFAQATLNSIRVATTSSRS
jgi:hypothetical protein